MSDTVYSTRTTVPATPALIAEIIATLERVSPEWPATRTETPSRTWATFTLPNGWRVEVFKDGWSPDDWDYIEWVDMGEGRVVEPEIENEIEAPLFNWTPARHGWEGYAPAHLDNPLSGPPARP